MHPHWTLACSFLNGKVLRLASRSIILTHKMQARTQKGAIQGLTAKTKVPKMVNCSRTAQVVLLLVQTTSKSPNFLVNVLFFRN